MRAFKQSAYSVCLLSAALVMNGCSDDDDTAATQDVELRFAAKVGDISFACGDVYTGIGVGQADRANYQVNDFRVLISEVAMTHADGSQVPVTLEQDGVWQYNTTALLDFEDGCSGNGTTETRSVVTGTVDGGDYTGVCFTIGVPFEENHMDTATAPSPLNASGMFWNWQGGAQVYSRRRRG